MTWDLNCGIFTKNSSDHFHLSLLNLLNPLKMIWFCFNMHFPYTPAWVYSGLVFNGFSCGQLSSALHLDNLDVFCSLLCCLYPFKLSSGCDWLSLSSSFHSLAVLMKNNKKKTNLTTYGSTNTLEACSNNNCLQIHTIKTNKTDNLFTWCLSTRYNMLKAATRYNMLKAATRYNMLKAATRYNMLKAATRYNILKAATRYNMLKAATRYNILKAASIWKGPQYKMSNPRRNNIVTWLPLSNCWNLFNTSLREVWRTSLLGLSAASFWACSVTFWRSP